MGLRDLIAAQRTSKYSLKLFLGFSNMQSLSKVLLEEWWGGSPNRAGGRWSRR